MKRLALAVLVGLLLMVAVAAGFAARVWSGLQRPFAAYASSPHIVAVDEGLTAAQILTLLEAEGVIEDAFWTRVYLSRYLEDPPLKSGEYSFETPLAATQVLDKLSRGEVLMHQVTVVEGLDLFETAEQLSAAGFGAEEEFLRLLQSPELVADLDPDATDLEGYLFPDTYSFAGGTPESDVVAALVANFRRKLAEEIRPVWPDDDRSLRELITLASIVEKETSLDEERPMVAGVYANRLRRGMGLYADPTVIYGLKLAGTWDGNLRRRDLEADNPYNTYRIAGLPPGPICSPGVASLRAAAQPGDVPYFYFVSRNDGSHVFARTLAEHNRNVQEWQKRYWQERWARERAQKPGSD